MLNMSLYLNFSEAVIHVYYNLWSCYSHSGNAIKNYLPGRRVNNSLLAQQRT